APPERPSAGGHGASAAQSAVVDARGSVETPSGRPRDGVVAVPRGAAGRAHLAAAVADPARGGDPGAGESGAKGPESEAVEAGAEPRSPRPRARCSSRERGRAAWGGYNSCDPWNMSLTAEELRQCLREAEAQAEAQ
ncbi:unnamed protein product, partial [Prorocentrum cordatum]